MLVAILVIVLFLVYFFAFQDSTKTSLLDDDEQIYVVSRQDLSKNVSVSGNLVFANVKTLASPIDGEIDRITFDYPYPYIVEAGEVLATLSDSDLVGLQSHIYQWNIDLELATQSLNSFLFTNQSNRLARAHSEVLEKENQLITARENLFSAVDDEDERANALIQIHLAEKELINSKNLLDDLLSPYPNRLSELVQVEINARHSMNDFEVTLNDLNDPLGSPEYLGLLSDLASLENSLEIAEKNQNLSFLSVDESLSTARINLESEEIDYLAILKKWFGVNDEEYLNKSPDEIYKFWSVDLQYLFDKQSRQEEVKAFLDNPIEPSKNLWDDNVVLTWLAMYPVEILGTCDPISSATLLSGSLPLPNIICVDYQLQLAWDELEDVRLLHDQANLEAQTTLQNHSEILRTASEQIDLKEEIIEDYLDSESLRIRDAKKNFNIAKSEHQLAVQNVQNWNDSLLELEVEIQKEDVVLKEAALETANRNFDNVFAVPSDTEISSLQLKVDLADAELSDALLKLEIAHQPDYSQQKFLENEIQRLEVSILDAQKKIEESFIKSPFDGVVLQYFVKEGQRVSQGLAVVEVAELNILNFEGSVGEAEVELVGNGMDVELSLDAKKDILITGKVENISIKSVMEQGVVTYPVVISIENPSGLVLTEGLSGVSEVLIEKAVGQIVVPMSAVKENDQGKFVNVKQDGLIVKRPVKLGINDNFWVAVLEGLNEKESIVIKSSKSSTEKFELDFGDDDEDDTRGSNSRRGPGRKDN